MDFPIHEKVVLGGWKDEVKSPLESVCSQKRDNIRVTKTAESFEHFQFFARPVFLPACSFQRLDGNEANIKAMLCGMDIRVS